MAAYAADFLLADGFQQGIAHFLDVQGDDLHPPFKVSMEAHVHNGNAQPEYGSNQGFGQARCDPHGIFHPLGDVVEGSHHPGDRAQKSQYRCQRHNDVQIGQVLFKFVQGPLCPVADEIFQELIISMAAMTMVASLAISPRVVSARCLAVSQLFSSIYVQNFLVNPRPLSGSTGSVPPQWPLRQWSRPAGAT